MALSYKTKKHHTKGIVLLCGRIEPSPVEHPVKSAINPYGKRSFGTFLRGEIFEKNVKSHVKTTSKIALFEIWDFHFKNMKIKEKP